MRFMGNKKKIINIIYEILWKNNVRGTSFFDFFAGTTNVGQFFKEKGYRVTSSDILYFSYCMQKAFIENNTKPTFSKLLPTIQKSASSEPLEDVAKYLNSIEPVEGFIYKNYTPSGTADLEIPRTYFTDFNGKKIDAIRIQIETWKNQNLISESEYFILIACLIETASVYANITGQYSAFLKHWCSNAVKPLEFRTISFIDNGKENKVYNSNSMELLDKIDTDILYLDPPYNGRQYASNYHLLETIAKYDNPKIKGVTGLRNYKSQKSRFCSRKTALEDLDTIAKTAKYKYLVLSYNSEGIMSHEEIMETLSKYGKVSFEQFEYARYKSCNKGLSKTKKTVFEQLYILEK